jgi:hypothetical protein
VESPHTTGRSPLTTWPAFVANLLAKLVRDLYGWPPFLEIFLSPRHNPREANKAKIALSQGEFARLLV